MCTLVTNYLAPCYYIFMQKMSSINVVIDVFKNKQITSARTCHNTNLHVATLSKDLKKCKSEDADDGHSDVSLPHQQTTAAYRLDMKIKEANVFWHNPKYHFIHLFNSQVHSQSPLTKLFLEFLFACTFKLSGQTCKLQV